MPVNSRKNGGTTELVQFRLDKDTAAYYRMQAKRNGVSLAEFLRNKIVQGLISESAHEIEDRMTAFAEGIGKSGMGGSMPDEALYSLFMCEALLTAIVEVRNIQEVYNAQDRATRRLSELKGKLNGAA